MKESPKKEVFTKKGEMMNSHKVHGFDKKYFNWRLSKN